MTRLQGLVDDSFLADIRGEGAPLKFAVLLLLLPYRNRLLTFLLPQETINVERMKKLIALLPRHG